MEVSDEISSNSLSIQLVNVAALLRRYSPSLHPLPRLLSHISALPPRNQSDSLIVQFYHARLVNSTRVRSRILGNQNRIPLKNLALISRQVLRRQIL
jgi:hypothetical protein